MVTVRLWLLCTGSYVQKCYQHVACLLLTLSVKEEKPVRRSTLPTGLAKGPKSRDMVCAWYMYSGGLEKMVSRYLVVCTAALAWYGELKLKIGSLS